MHRDTGLYAVGTKVSNIKQQNENTWKQSNAL